MSTQYVCGCVERDGVRNTEACGDGHVYEPPAEMPTLVEGEVLDDEPVEAAPKKKATKKK
jgi:hypothetical protein